MDAFRLKEVAGLLWIQSKLDSLGALFITGCHIGDPAFPYIYFPVLMSVVSEQAAFKVIWAIVVSEWFNAIIKWTLNDHRPYWWIPEYHPSSTKIPLKQFDITCETGPGNPSGHVMCSTCVAYVIYVEVMRNRILKSETQSRLMLSLLLVCLSIVAFGRMYISAHFPSQCVLGFCGGLLTGIVVDKYVNVAQFKTNLHVLTAVAITISVYGTYFILNATIDANWSLKLAQKWCFDIQYVKADTTPLVVVWRTSGALIGSAIAFDLLPKLIRRFTPSTTHLPNKLIIGLLATFVCWLFMQWTKPSSSLASLTYFYTVVFIRHSILPSIGYLLVCFFHQNLRQEQP